MLYVFRVDTGTTHSFDLSLSRAKVTALKEEVYNACKIAVEKQVLLISGGESLDNKRLVSSYGAGTDTNPIFLFSQASLETHRPPSPRASGDSEDGSFEERIKGSHSLPSSREALVSRTQLAVDMWEVGSREVEVCRGLLQDQHLQHQGWSAVIANLDDISSDLKSKFARFKTIYREYLEKRAERQTQLAGAESRLGLLSRIPILPALIEASSVYVSRYSPGDTLTLLTWIKQQDERNSLEQLIDLCRTELSQLDEVVLASLEQWVEEKVVEANNESMRAVGGLSDRLRNMDVLLQEATQLQGQQAALKQAFAANQQRAFEVDDETVLGELCESHRQQLHVMGQQHRALRDKRLKCSKSKDELSANLHARLRWVMYVEREMLSVHSKLLMHHDLLKRLKIKLQVVSQVNSAPELYAASLLEVQRRRGLATTFLQWAGEVSESARAWHESEQARRQTFQRLMGRHFLQRLFRGLEDPPAAFATEAPQPFDQRLPDVTTQDIRALRQAFPELGLPEGEGGEDELLSRLTALQPFTRPEGGQQADDAEVLGTSPSLHHPAPHPLTTESAVIEGPVPTAADVALQRLSLSSASPSSPVSIPQITRARSNEGVRGLGSTSPNVPSPGCSPTDYASSDFRTAYFDTQTSEPPSHTDASDIQERVYGDEMRRLMGVIREEMRELKDQHSHVLTEVGQEHGAFAEDTQGLATQVMAVLQQVRERCEAAEERVGEEVARASQAEATLASLAQQVEKKEEELVKLREEWECRCEDVKEELETKIAEAEDKVEAVRRELTLQHELELDACRSELQVQLTAAEARCRELEREEAARSSSRAQVTRQHELALEVQQQEFVRERGELAQVLEQQYRRDTELQLSQAQDDLRGTWAGEMQRREADWAVSERERTSALRQELEEAKARLAALQRKATVEVAKVDEATAMSITLTKDQATASSLTPEESDERLQDLTAKLKEEHERQLGEERERWAREKEADMTSQKQQLLAESQVSFRGAVKQACDKKDLEIMELRDKLESLELPAQQEPSEDPLVRSAMEESVMHVSPDAEVEASLRAKDNKISELKLQLEASSPRASNRDEKVSITTCNVGDLVLLCLHEKHGHYVVFSLGTTLHFLHSECLRPLALHDQSPENKKMWVLAQVTDKEYCQAKKPNNRFRVPVSTRFYRVKAQPWVRDKK